jgi:type II secretory pathway pseudopilin PulG
LLVVVLACLAIVSSLGLSALTSTIRMHRESTRAFQLRQTQLLIDSAILRAEALREQGKDVINETWTPRLPGDAYTAEINIKTKDKTLFITSTLRSASGFQTRRSDQVPF